MAAWLRPISSSRFCKLSRSREPIGRLVKIAIKSASRAEDPRPREPAPGQGTQDETQHHGG